MNLNPLDLMNEPRPGASFAEPPPAVFNPTAHRQWQKDLLRWVRQHRPLTLLHSARFKLTSRPLETEGHFRGRLSQLMREKRDLQTEKLRRKYAAKFTTLNQRLLKARQAISREKEEAQTRKMETAISFGSAVLGAFLGRKTVSSRSVTRMGAAMKSAGRLRQEIMDVARAEENAQLLSQQLKALEARFQEDLEALEDQLDPAAEALTPVLIHPKSSDLHLEWFMLLWLPHYQRSEGNLQPAWNSSGKTAV